MRFQEKEKLLRYVLRRYPDPEVPGALREESQPYGRDRELKQEVDRILRRLPRESRRIIMEEFIRHADPDWWYGFYSRSTYYRLKNEAMDGFIDCLHG